MERSDDEVYLEHVLEAARSIEETLKSVTRAEFDKKRMVQNGFVRELEIIGEAARHVSEGFRRKHVEVPWEKIMGMRNRLVHDYMGVDLDVVWTTARDFVPELKERIEEILS